MAGLIVFAHYAACLFRIGFYCRLLSFGIQSMCGLLVPPEITSWWCDKDSGSF